MAYTSISRYVWLPIECRGETGESDGGMNGRHKKLSLLQKSSFHGRQPAGYGRSHPLSVPPVSPVYFILKRDERKCKSLNPLFFKSHTTHGASMQESGVFCLAHGENILCTACILCKKVVYLMIEKAAE